MHIKCLNVNDAFHQVVRGIHEGTIPTSERPSRNGSTLTIEEPFTVTYLNPTERVLFNQARDVNPFFHLYEALWMLAGRNDVAPLAYYLTKITEFSDDGKTFNAAYGWRWRRGPREENREYIRTVDQLDFIVNHLKDNPESRRAVLSMWNVEDDLLKIEQSKDVACNLCVTFQLRNKDTGIDGYDETLEHGGSRVLDITVFNRSNDLIWGTLGANAVHFSILQEYMAARLGVEVGYYHQVSSNAHVYSWNWKPIEWLSEYGKRTMHSPKPVTYSTHVRETVPLVQDPEVFEKEVHLFVEQHKWYTMGGYYSEPFLAHVAQPLCLAFHRQRLNEFDGAKLALESCQADDWRIAATNWIEKRKKLREDKAKFNEEREKYHGGQHEGVE